MSNPDKNVQAPADIPAESVKPREVFVLLSEKGNLINAFVDERKDTIKFVEHSALETLNATIQTLTEKLADAVGACALWKRRADLQGERNSKMQDEIERLQDEIRAYQERT